MNLIRRILTRLQQRRYGWIEATEHDISILAGGGVLHHRSLCQACKDKK